MWMDLHNNEVPLYRLSIAICPTKHHKFKLSAVNMKRFAIGKKLA